MAVRRLVGQAQAAWEVPRDLLLGRYPEFVTGGTLGKGQIPVFVFHSLEPESFARKLRYLAENGYGTLSSDEYLEVLVGSRPAPAGAVVLSFDDGRSSVYDVGLPLMQRYGMKGIVFLIPGLTPERTAPPPTDWDAGGQGRAASDTPPTRESTPGGAFLSWQQVEALSRSGLFDFQSHTLSHCRIHVGPRLAGFMTPAQRDGYAALEVPLIHEGGRDLRANEVPLGTPLLRSQPRTSESPRFIEDPEARAACIRAVAEAGGEGFFRRSDWESRLRRLLRGQAVSGRFETPEQREAAIRLELVEPRHLIEVHTGRPVLHLCYPWHASGPTARRLAREAGYLTAFCGKVRGVPITPPGGDTFAIARISEDFLERLPGRGRVELATILRMKWVRRRSGT